MNDDMGKIIIAGAIVCMFVGILAGYHLGKDECIKTFCSNDAAQICNAKNILKESGL